MSIELWIRGFRSYTPEKVTALEEIKSHPLYGEEIGYLACDKCGQYLGRIEITDRHEGYGDDVFGIKVTCPDCIDLPAAPPLNLEWPQKVQQS
jgi:hypothetical protein